MVRRRPVPCLLGRWRGRYWAWSIFRLMFSILTWMELKGSESQGLGDPKWGRLHTRDHEGTAKGREPRAVLAAFAGRWAPALPACAAHPSITWAVGVFPCGTGRHEWPDGRGRGAEAASGLQEPEVCVQGGGSPFLPATRRAGAGRGEACGAAQTRAPSDPTRRGWALSLSGPRFRSHRGAAGSENASDALRGCPPDFPWAEGGPQGEASAWVTKNCCHNQDRE